MEEIIAVIAAETGLPLQNVRGAVQLLEQGATVPFISRYRKEVTGDMNEVQVERILDRMLELKELQHRKEYIISTIADQEKLTEELEARIRKCWDVNEIEDIYLPFKPKRKTRAEAARQKGLEPLAKIIMAQDSHPVNAGRFVTDEVKDEAEAIQGAMDIIAAWVNEDSRVRRCVRGSFERTAMFTCKVIKGKEEEGEKYRNYFDVREPLKRVASHRILAMLRGADAGILRVKIEPAADTPQRIEKLLINAHNEKSAIVQKAIQDAYTRLLCPSIENEFMALSKRTADEQAIEVFAANLRELLLAAPLGQRALMAIDPGIRTGCKVVILDAQGNLIHNDTIYPHSNRDKMVYAEMQLLKMIDKYDVKVIAIGNGTAGRETREFIEELQAGDDIEIYMVNEDGASVYSASEVARREFPDHDVTVRGAVSIGRRLMDPLSELVKIDPKSIGVGQYQHDVDGNLLRKKLDSVTSSCVNSVGVNLNTAGRELLTYVSGIGPALALNIVNFRKENGPFASRRQLLKVPRLGAKAYEQAAGFLRIPDAKNPLDNSAVHPERYPLIEKIASDLHTDIITLLKTKELRENIQPKDYINESLGESTFADILAELEKPGRDPREKLKQFSFDNSISSIADVHADMILPGKIVNITDFGCFVDLGIKTKGLVHISKLSKKRVRNAREVVKLQQEVMVKVIDVEEDRNRISLTMVLE